MVRSKPLLIFNQTVVLLFIVFAVCIYCCDGYRIVSKERRQQERDTNSTDLPDRLQSLFPNLNRIFNIPTELILEPTSNRWYLAEIGGYIWTFPNSLSVTDEQVTLFANLTFEIYSFGLDLGLLSIAFDPRYGVDNNYLYAFYNIRFSEVIPYANIISRIAVTNPLNANVDSLYRILTIPKVPGSPDEYLLNNGGELAFHPTASSSENRKLLYVSMGDSEDRVKAQDLQSLLGKVLRIDVTDTDPELGITYDIPEDNPFFGSEFALGEIYAYGFRNPWRLSFGLKVTDDYEEEEEEENAGEDDYDLWLTDAGEYFIEEVNVVKKGGNYGWPIFEGTTCLAEDGSTCEETVVEFPVYQYFHMGFGCEDDNGTIIDNETMDDNGTISDNDTDVDNSTCTPNEFQGIAVVGGEVYTGRKFPALRNHFIFGDFIGNIWALKINADVVVDDDNETVSDNDTISDNETETDNDTTSVIYLGSVKAIDSEDFITTLTQDPNTGEVYILTLFGKVLGFGKAVPLSVDSACGIVSVSDNIAIIEVDYSDPIVGALKKTQDLASDELIFLVPEKLGATITRDLVLEAAGEGTFTGGPNVDDNSTGVVSKYSGVSSFLIHINPLTPPPENETRVYTGQIEFGSRILGVIYNDKQASQEELGLTCVAYPALPSTGRLERSDEFSIINDTILSLDSFIVNSGADQLRVITDCGDIDFTSCSKIWNIEGDITFIQPPIGLFGEGTIEGPNILIFLEQENFIVTEAVPVDALFDTIEQPPVEQITIPSGNYSRAGNLSSGVTVSSFLLHFDPDQNVTAQEATATVSFNGLITGLVWGEENLSLTDSIFGSPCTSYGLPLRKSEGYDRFEIFGSTIMVRFRALDGIDQVRVLVSCN